MEPILFVAPTESSAKSAASVAAEMRVNFPIIVSRREDVQKVARKHPDINIYISRGGVAEALAIYLEKRLLTLKLQ